jgi:hypothetical protein
MSVKQKAMQELEKLFDNNFNIDVIDNDVIKPIHLRYDLKQIWRDVFGEELTFKDLIFIK